MAQQIPLYIVIYISHENLIAVYYTYYISLKYPILFTVSILDMITF